ncbi:putative membrane protein [Francisella tularensis subsp. tularensis str. SCHU S4 substr. NR-28534]|nr:putative membrane protein [Francisella tularensis subsp. tularensis str. SCHU S4 substr. NR-28534]
MFQKIQSYYAKMHIYYVILFIVKIYSNSYYTYAFKKTNHGA